MMSRIGPVPRSVFPLLILVIAVGAYFLFGDGSRQEPDYTLGGPILPCEPGQIETLVITRPGGQFRLDRDQAGVWRLSGSVQDYVDPQGMLGLLTVLAQARGGAVLPGTESEDHRYGFHGNDFIRLRILVEDGRESSLFLGTANPVTNRFYASGAGRPVTFTVAPELREVLAALPAKIQTRRLLPRLDRTLIREVRLRSGGRDFLLRRHHGLWWLRPIQQITWPFGFLARSYHDTYGDRLRSDAVGESWLLANDAKVRLLIYEVSDVAVKRIPPRNQQEQLRREWNLDASQWELELVGPGINPDPAAGPDSILAIALNPALEKDEVPALRWGNVLVAEGEAINTLTEPLSELVHTGAFSFLVAAADSFRLELVDPSLDGVLPLIWARPSPVGWRSFAPAGYRPAVLNDRTGKEAADLVVNLDRTSVLAVLPPVRDPAVLADRERLRLTIWLDSSPEVRNRLQVGAEPVVLEFGFLQPAALSPETTWRTQPPDGLPPVALWRPRTGQLLQVPGQLVVTGRNLRTNYIRE